jgi:hypothetical protein
VSGIPTTTSSPILLAARLRAGRPDKAPSQTLVDASNRQEPGQHRSMREAILETSGLISQLDQAIETLREVAK